MIRAVRRFAWGTREFLWPRRCAGCGLRDTWLCDECSVDPMTWNPDWCDRCGVPDSLRRCSCDVLPGVIDAARAIGPHEGWLRNSVRLLKYSDERARAVPLGRMIAERVRDLERIDVIVPVPLSARRERERGFNQAIELASVVAHENRMSLDTSCIQRSRDTPPQVGLARSMRQQNVKGAFSLVDAGTVRGKSVLVIDDVFTTGATLAELAGLLKIGGAWRVSVATATRADHYLSQGMEIVDAGV